jgi:hypothetical protein
MGRTVNLWDAATGEPLRQLGDFASIWVARVAFSPDGRALAVGSDNAVSLWEVATGGKRAEFAGHAGTVHALAFAPDGRRLASGSDDTTILVWDLAGPAAGPLSAAALDALWADLAEDSARAHRAIRALAATPEKSVPLLRKRLPRAAAPTAETRKQFARLLTNLDSDDFATRRKADSMLETLGSAAEPLVRSALDGRLPLEVRRRLERFIRALESKEKANWTRALRALEVLELAASPEARQLLTDLAAGDPAARLVREAKAVLGRLKARP